MSFAAPCPKKIIRKALAGDKLAFAEIYNTYKQPVYSLAYRMLQDVDASSDILQQVFLKVMTRLSDINDHTKLGSWIKRVTYNCAIDYIRANSRESLGINVDHFADDFLAPQANSFNDYDLDVLLKTLNARERTVIILFSVEEYTHQEIASMLSISESNSKQICSRAIKKLSQLAVLERYSGNKVGSYD